MASKCPNQHIFLNLHRIINRKHQSQPMFLLIQSYFQEFTHEILGYACHQQHFYFFYCLLILEFLNILSFFFNIFFLLITHKGRNLLRISLLHLFIYIFCPGFDGFLDLVGEEIQTVTDFRGG